MNTGLTLQECRIKSGLRMLLNVFTVMRTQDNAEKKAAMCTTHLSCRRVQGLRVSGKVSQDCLSAGLSGRRCFFFPNVGSGCFFS